jgi:wyosine [tRNA(Phe)-imidazoG37] synthetase (radical SAM superfamily)
MEYVFGPVPSRRLGSSLGIDPLPYKTCNWNCVYCQLGRSRPLVTERRDYVHPDVVLTQVERALRTHGDSQIDWITFVGSGEPTLHADLGAMIRRVKSMTRIPVAVITNGSLLYRQEVRDELAAADAVLPSLDAGSERLYRAINRPSAEPAYDVLIQGLVDFRRAFAGRLWIEVMLLRDVNDTPPALDELSAVLGLIKPDDIHINLPIRPPAESWVRPAADTAVARAVRVLGARVFSPPRGSVDVIDRDRLLDAVKEIVARHPMREDDLLRALGCCTPGEVSKALAMLAESDAVQVVQRFRRRYWCSAAGIYATHRSRGEPMARDPAA